MSYYWTTPTSALTLRKYATNIRKLLNCNDVIAFPILKILDYLMDEGALIFQILENDDPYFDENELAKFDFIENTIYAKEEVYLEALNNVGRSRFTLAHELAHFILLRIFNFDVFLMDEEPLAFQNPEWQANTLAAEILLPYELTKKMTVEEMIEACLVSEECAIVTYDRRRKNI